MRTSSVTPSYPLTISHALGREGKVAGRYFLDHTSLIWSVSVSICCRLRDSGSIHTFPFANRNWTQYHA